jgi:hypothetical protein
MIVRIVAESSKWHAQKCITHEESIHIINILSKSFDDEKSRRALEKSA